jgi:hypothetical protein
MSSRTIRPLVSRSRRCGPTLVSNRPSELPRRCFNLCILDYMFKRRIFTMDQGYFPTARMREIIDYLHKHDQRYGMFDS